MPGFVSTEVDANLSFNIGALVARARKIVDAYKQRGVGPDGLLIKFASTWEGIRAAETLQSEGVKCNMTLLLNRAQAIASAEAGAFLISPFVGRIYDWHKSLVERTSSPPRIQGVRSVGHLRYYKSNGIETIVMGASFSTPARLRRWPDAIGWRSRQLSWTLLRPRRASSNASWRRPPQSHAPFGRRKTGSAIGS